VIASDTLLVSTGIPAGTAILVALIGLLGLGIKRRDDQRFSQVVGSGSITDEQGGTKSLIDTVRGLTQAMTMVQTNEQECQVNLQHALSRIAILEKTLNV
jgi:hypothetical protein